MKLVSVNLDYCMECRSCTVACYYSHYKRTVLDYTNVKIMATVPVHCRHCEEPLCMAACPSNAVKKLENGAVKIFDSLCIGCKSCAIACPFGTITPKIESYVNAKCDLCLQNLKRGEIPNCVLTCPSGALRFGTRDEFEKDRKFNVGAQIIARQKFFRR